MTDLLKPKAHTLLRSVLDLLNGGRIAAADPHTREQVYSLREQIEACLASDQAPEVDLACEDWKAIELAASESPWMPKEYMRNEWVSDVCSFLRGPRAAEQAQPIAGMPTRKSLGYMCLGTAERENQNIGYNQCMDDWESWIRSDQELPTPYDLSEGRAGPDDCEFSRMQGFNEGLEICFAHVGPLLVDNKRMDLMIAQEDHNYDQERATWTRMSDEFKSRIADLESLRGEPITVEAVAITRLDEEGSLCLDWLVEGGISALEIPGQVLVVAHGVITDEEGSGEVYLHAAERKPEPDQRTQDE